MSLVREGKIDNVDVEIRHASKATETLDDLKNGKISGLVCLTHEK